MPLSANLGKLLRETLDSYQNADLRVEELIRLKPLFDLQQELSSIPKQNELLIEHIET